MSQVPVTIMGDEPEKRTPINMDRPDGSEVGSGNGSFESRVEPGEYHVSFGDRKSKPSKHRVYVRPGGLHASEGDIKKHCETV